jgi:serine/threonine protein kinase
MLLKYPIGIFFFLSYANSDIKPENFLLKNKDDITNVKMIDFGLSKDYSEVKMMQTPSGSVIFSFIIIFSLIILPLR